MKNQTYGIEIELIHPTNHNAKALAARTIADAIGGTYGYNQAIDQQGRTWKATHDGSIRGGFGVEVVSPIMKYDDIETIQTVVRALRAAGFKANQSCGIHIHVGMKTTDGETITTKGLVNLAKMVNSKQGLILDACQTAQRRRETFCKPLEADRIARIEKAKNMNQLQRAWFNGHPNNSHYDYNRYHALNYNAIWYHGTVEFRLFESSLHAGKIKTYIQLSLALVAKARNARSASSKPLRTNNAKYNTRVFLNSLGLIGDEFKTARHHLIKHLPGDTAWRTEGQAQAAREARNQASDNNQAVAL